MDTALNRNTTVIDEGSSAFLVITANSGMTEVDLAALATQKATSQKVKDFASMLVHDHSAVNDQVKVLAAQKNITLPATISEDKQKQIDDMKKKSGKTFDKAFIDAMVNGHEDGISRFEKALIDAKDPDINSFADKTLMKLRVHLDSAKTIQASLK